MLYNVRFLYGHLQSRSLNCNQKAVNLYIIFYFFLLEYVEAFKCFDLNENGHLSTKELKYAMRMLGLNPTDIEVQELVNGLDYDGKESRNVNGKVLWEVERAGSQN